jgi:CRP/FNR family cyclic AMP-dependent transcriptional regulator
MKIRLFDKDTNSVVYPEGHVVFNRGDAGEHMYAVIAGSVDIIIQGRTIETVEVGGVFGEMALIEGGGPRSATAVVRSEAKLVPIDKNRFLFLVQQTPFFAVQLLTIVTQRLRRINQMLEEEPRKSEPGSTAPNAPQG